MSLDRVENSAPSTDSLNRPVPRISTDRAVLSISNNEKPGSLLNSAVPISTVTVRGDQSPHPSTAAVNSIGAGPDSSGLPQEPASVVDDHRVLPSHADSPANELSSAVSPQSISPEAFQSPKSLSSSNRTPTQADFGPNTLNRDIPSPPSPLHPFTTPIPSGSDNRVNASADTFSQSMPIYGHEDTREEVPHANEFSNSTLKNAFSLSQGKANSNALQEAQQPRGNQRTLVTTPRASEDSGATFHTADSGEDFQMREQTGRAVAIPPRSLPHPIREIAVRTSLRRAGNGNRSNSASQQTSGANSATNSGESNNASRPFSFISFGQVHVGDLKLGGPSLDNGRGRLYKELPATPASSDHGGQISGKQRPRSFSRPFQDPNLHDHPAFRQGNAELDDSNLPTTSYPPQARREEAMIAQGTEFQLDGIGPPTVEDINKSRAHRGSRGAAFLKRLSLPPAQEVPHLPKDPEARVPGSPSESPISQKKKGRRVSLFRSLTGRSGSDSGHSPGNSAAQPARAQTDLQQYMDKLPPSQTQYSSTIGQATTQSPPIRQESSAPSKQPESTSTSDVPKQEKGKKKRFSNFGVYGNLYIHYLSNG